jgi:hypothetical protein
MAPAVGGVAHGSVNARPRAEWARTAHRQKKEPSADAHRIARVPCDEFLFFVFLAEALKKNTVCPVKFFLPPKELVSGFNLDSLTCATFEFCEL